ncbi:hypothetical protein NHX12_033503 [Muraenolepis orangiensis]|uniref:Uncharacterized protein n=1 Tax=Muraenolepis orangiensis TaxID=630683 RepID=A0A9Q0II14_9TELE|nr:hypothetical protein NHX12_033503 [Muraenolepis orangiensis]
MNWDNQLSSILSAADGSVAKMRERLTSPGTFSKGSPDLFPAIGSLTKKVQSMESERESQQHRIRLLEEEIRSLREESRGWEKDDTRRGQSPGTERMMEQWRREIGHELSTLRGHITRATSLGNLEESFSSKLQREELEHLRWEVDQLKARLRRQEEEMFGQQSETLEQLVDTSRTYSFDLAKAASQHKVSVSELKDKVSNLMLGEHRPSASSASDSRVHTRCGPEPRGGQSDCDSEDFSPTPSLAEISSDDLSWLDDLEPAHRQKSVPHVRLSTQSRPCDIAGPSRDLGDDDDDDDDDDKDLDDDVNLGSDLSLDDL